MAMTQVLPAIGLVIFAEIGPSASPVCLLPHCKFAARARQPGSGRNAGQRHGHGAHPRETGGRCKMGRRSSSMIFQALVQPLLTIAVVHLLAAMSPGPSFITVSRTALVSGRSAGLASALACGFGVLPWAIGAMLGIMIVFNRAPWLYAALKAAGGLYLLFLAVMVWRHAASPIAVGDGVPRQTLSQAFRQTFLIQITNPKVAVFFSAI